MGRWVGGGRWALGKGGIVIFDTSHYTRVPFCMRCTFYTKQRQREGLLSYFVPSDKTCNQLGDALLDRLSKWRKNFVGVQKHPPFPFKSPCSNGFPFNPNPTQPKPLLQSGNERRLNRRSYRRLTIKKKKKKFPRLKLTRGLKRYFVKQFPHSMSTYSFCTGYSVKRLDYCDWTNRPFDWI